MFKIKFARSLLVLAALLTFVWLRAIPLGQAKAMLIQGTTFTAQQETLGTHFRGQIASSKFEMILWRDGQSLRGTYYYVKSGSANSLNLQGKIDETGEFTMQEVDQSGKQTGEFTGVWKDDPNQSGAGLEGEWRKPSAKEGSSFFASEQLTAFTNGTKIKSVSTNESFKTKRLDVSAEYPELTGAANAAGFNQMVKTTVMKETAAFKKEKLQLSAADLKSLPEGSNNYLDISYSTEYADDDFISVSFLESTYSGGAHPNYSFFTLNYDLKNGKELKLADLFKPGARYLQTIAAYCTKNLQSRTDGGENSGLAQDIWEDGAKPTAENYQSWNATRKGLMVTFAPYQVGSYAAGAQYVIVPYAELKDLIKPTGLPLKMLK